MASQFQRLFLFFFPSEFGDTQHRLQIWNLKFRGSILMTEMESPLEVYADWLGFHFNGYCIWRLFCRRVGDALTTRIQLNPGLQKHHSHHFSQTPMNFWNFRYCINLNLTHQLRPIKQNLQITSNTNLILHTEPITGIHQIQRPHISLRCFRRHRCYNIGNRRQSRRFIVQNPTNSIQTSTTFVQDYNLFCTHLNFPQIKIFRSGIQNIRNENRKNRTGRARQQELVQECEKKSPGFFKSQDFGNGDVEFDRRRFPIRRRRRLELIENR